MLKIFNYNNNGASKKLEVFLNKRKSTQKNIAFSVYKIIQEVKRNGDKAVLNYEKKYSKIKIKSNKIFFSNKEINQIAKKTDIKIKKAIIGTYMSGENIISVIPGTSAFWSIIFSNPLPIETAKKI